jgi:3-oxoadipate enol-lactonase
VAKPNITGELLSPPRPLGENALLVVGPSLGTSSALWTDTGRLLGDEFDVIAWDLPGDVRALVQRLTHAL